jgi:hypothetical protein
MPKNKGLTLDEHRAAGILMKQSYEDTLQLTVLFAKAYPHTTGPYVELVKAKEALLKAKDIADDLLFKEHPDLADAKTYYGPMKNDK